MFDAIDKGLNVLLCENFAGKVVRKDLTKKIKEGANVPIYVLEYLLGMYCATDDEESINDGVQRVKSILADNFVRPDEAEKIKSKIREIGTYTVIDKVEAKLDPENDNYKAVFSNLNLKDVIVSDNYIKEFEKLLSGGIWCIVRMNYNRLDARYDDFDSDAPKGKKNKISPFEIEELTPIQMPNMDMQEFFDGRSKFTKDEWIDVLLRSIGMESTHLENRVKWHMLARMIPLVENNYNLCELGPRGTGKSHIYKEISPNSILVSGGQTTVANLFYNMVNRTIGLVGMWDCVAFDEVAGITFKDKDGIQIMKDFMASGSFARGKEEKSANASTVFVGNINQSVEVMLKTSHLFEPFPDAMAYDCAFFDRMHFYLPGWEIPKMRPELLTNEYGFITDYIAEFFREMRKRSFSDAIDKFFRLGNNLNQRDVIAVRKTVSGLLKLIYPHGEFTKEDVAEVLEYALEGRRRVKEQLKKIGGMEFYDVHFSYLDNETFEENFVSVPEQGTGKLIPDGQGRAGHIYTVARGDSGMIGTFKIETEVVGGNGKFEVTGAGSDRVAKESLKTAQNYFKANKKLKSVCLIIHGFAGSTEEIEYLANSLEIKGVVVCTVALAGHGGTKKELTMSSFKDWINSVDCVVQTLKQEYENINLVGFSMGGLICTHFECYPEINKIVFINTPIYFWNVKIIINDLISGIREKKFDKIAYYRKSALGVSIKSSVDFLQILRKSKILFPNIKKPCLIVQCLNDESVHYKSGKYIKDKIGDSAVLKYLDGGCHQIFLNSPELRDLVCNDIYDFFDENNIQ